MPSLTIEKQFRKHVGLLHTVVIKILQGNVLTQIMLGGLSICLPVAMFLWCMCATIYESWLAVDKVMAKNTRLTCLWLNLYCETQ